MGEAKVKAQIEELKGKARDAREIVDMLDALIVRRIRQQYDDRPDEEAEVLKRAITDYLLQTDPRPGIYVKDKVPIYGPPRKG
jgi:hypothetical protein